MNPVEIKRTGGVGVTLYDARAVIGMHVEVREHRYNAADEGEPDRFVAIPTRRYVVEVAGLGGVEVPLDVFNGIKAEVEKL